MRLRGVEGLSECLLCFCFMRQVHGEKGLSGVAEGCSMIGAAGAELAQNSCLLSPGSVYRGLLRGEIVAYHRASG